MPKFYLLSLGCPKNTVNSEKLQIKLLELGWQQSVTPQKADLLILNTCAFIQPAIEEAYAHIQSLIKIKSKKQKLAILGCLPARKISNLKKEFPQIDYVFSRENDLIPHLQKEPNKKFIVPSRLNLGLPYAYLKIAEGCSHKCSFCTIPQIKGPYHSFNSKDIMGEIDTLLSEGIKEIILIAQDTASYGQDLPNKNLASLLKKICQNFSQLPWLRILYVYPHNISTELIETISSYPQICPYLDIPIQHSSPHILKAMKRPYQNEKLEKILKELRKKIPSLILRTTFIVGFPGETEEDFQHLLDFIQRHRFQNVGVFPYYPEKGTPAATYPHQVPTKIKEERINRLMSTQQKIAKQNNQKLIGQTLKVLVENKIQTENTSSNSQDNTPTLFHGRSYRDAPEIDGSVIIEGDCQLNTFYQVKITQAFPYDLKGNIV